MIRVAMMGLSRRIHAGNPAKDGLTFKGGGQDVTSDVVKAIIEFVGVGETHEVTVDGVPMYEISICACDAQANGESQ